MNVFGIRNNPLNEFRTEGGRVQATVPRKHYVFRQCRTRYLWVVEVVTSAPTVHMPLGNIWGTSLLRCLACIRVADLFQRPYKGRYRQFREIRPV